VARPGPWATQFAQVAHGNNENRHHAVRSEWNGPCLRQLLASARSKLLTELNPHAPAPCEATRRRRYTAMRSKSDSDNVLHFPRPHADAPNPPPAGTTKTDPRKATFWTWLSRCLVEGFALYGASMYPPALYHFGPCSAEAKDPQSAESSPVFPDAIVDPQKDRSR
jgi:hypothetical protein